MKQVPVPDFPLCLGVLKHRNPLDRWPLPANFCLCGAILNLKAFYFGAIPDIMIELIVYGSVPQNKQSWQWLSGIETKLAQGLICLKSSTGNNEGVISLKWHRTYEKRKMTLLLDSCIMHSWIPMQYRTHTHSSRAITGDNTLITDYLCIYT